MVQMKAATIQCAIYYESKMSDNNRTKVRRGGEVPIARFQYQRLRCHVGLLGLIAAIHHLPGYPILGGLYLYLPSVWPNFKADVTPEKEEGRQQLCTHVGLSMNSTHQTHTSE